MFRTANVSCISRCPHFRGVLNDGFHCILRAFQMCYIITVQHPEDRRSVCLPHVHVYTMYMYNVHCTYTHMYMYNVDDIMYMYYIVGVISILTAFSASVFICANLVVICCFRDNSLDNCICRIQ